MSRLLLIDCRVESPEELSRELAEHSPEYVIVAVARFAALVDENKRLHSQLADRKAIERAKGILMKQRGCSEEQAFTALRTLAMQRGLSLGEVARQVLDVSSLLG